MRKLYVLLFIFIGLLSFWSYGLCDNNQEKAVSSFDKKVEIFKAFFSANPKILEKQKLSKSPTGFIYYWTQMHLLDISYDIQKTDSLISPYMGYIEVKCLLKASRRCGDVKGIFDHLYFSNIDSARQNKTNISCYVGSANIGAKFIFAFQKSKWIFKKVINSKTGHPYSFISAALGMPMGGWLYVNDNDYWQKLIE